MTDKDSIIAQQRALIEKLIEENKNLRAIIDELREEIARLKKNSSNSSKPPSSDIVKPPKKKSKGNKRKRGGQKGQGRRESRLTLDQAQEILHYHPKGQPCPKCGTRLVETDEKSPAPVFNTNFPSGP